MAAKLLIGDIFGNAARATPSRLAVVCRERSLDFATLDLLSNQLARLLTEQGIERGSRIASWSSTTIDMAPLFAALAKLGALFMPLNGVLGPAEIQPFVEASKPDAVIADASHSAAAKSALPIDVFHLESILEQAAGLDAEPLTLDESCISGTDPHAVFFTSGSTGRPKGVVVSQEANYLRSHPGALLEPRGAMICPYPLFHMGAWTIAMQQWQARDTVVLLEAADAGDIREAVVRYGATRLNCIPAVWRRILKELEQSGATNDFDSVRFADTGTSATPLQLLEAIERALPKAHIRVFYGSTEAGIVTSLDHADIRRKPGSCGVPGPGVRVRTDEYGELWVKSATLFDRYLDDQASTEDALVDGWYQTGDLADIDEDGFVTVVGRAGDVIRTGGEAVAPSEVESVLAGLSLVKDVAVVGVPDDTWGEIVCAFVVPAEPRAVPTVEELRARCAGRLASYKHPRRVEVVDTIPRTAATGQVQRRLLVERLLSA